MKIRSSLPLVLSALAVVLGLGAFFQSTTRADADSVPSVPKAGLAFQCLLDENEQPQGQFIDQFNHINGQPWTWVPSTDPESGHPVCHIPVPFDITGRYMVMPERVFTQGTTRFVQWAGLPGPWVSIDPPVLTVGAGYVPGEGGILAYLFY